MHEGDPLRIGPPDAPVAAIFAHGRGGSAADMASLARAMGDRVRWVFPQATGNSWWPHSFLAPLAANEPSMGEAARRIDALAGELVRGGLAPERIVLGGFSQGGCLAAECLRRHRRRYGGAVIFTGGLAGPPGAAWAPEPALAGMPVFISGAEGDAWVPPARVRETADWLERSGAAVTLAMDPSAAHTVRPSELSQARGLIERVAAGGPRLAG